VHAAVDTMGHLLALKVTPANEQERAQVADLVEKVQAAGRWRSLTSTKVTREKSLLRMPWPTQPDWWSSNSRKPNADLCSAQKLGG